MEYKNVVKIAQLWGISERTVRNYCAEGRIDGAKLIGKTWSIPADSRKDWFAVGKVDEKEKKIYEIADDPLMNKGDEFFIFATANDNGTYTIMSGPQGRFEIKDGQVYSLNAGNEQGSKEEFYKQVKEYTEKR